MTILDTVIYIQNNSLWIIFILEGMTASQKDHDRNLPTGMSFPGRQSPVGCRLGLWAMAPEWPAMHMGSNRAQHCLGTWAQDSPRAWEGIFPSLLCTSDHIVNITLHAGKTSAGCLELRRSTKAVKMEPLPCEERLWGMLKWFFFHSYAKTDKKDIIKT